VNHRRRKLLRTQNGPRKHTFTADEKFIPKTVFGIGEREAFPGSAGILPAKIARTIQCICFAGKMPAPLEAKPRQINAPMLFLNTIAIRGSAGGFALP